MFVSLQDWKYIHSLSLMSLTTLRICRDACKAHICTHTAVLQCTHVEALFRRGFTLRRQFR